MSTLDPTQFFHDLDNSASERYNALRLDIYSYLGPFGRSAESRDCMRWLAETDLNLDKVMATLNHTQPELLNNQQFQLLVWNGLSTMKLLIDLMRRHEAPDKACQCTWFHNASVVKNSQFGRIQQLASLCETIEVKLVKYHMTLNLPVPLGAPYKPMNTVQLDDTPAMSTYNTSSVEKIHQSRVAAPITNVTTFKPAAATAPATPNSAVAQFHD